MRQNVKVFSSPYPQIFKFNWYCLLLSHSERFEMCSRNNSRHSKTALRMEGSSLTITRGIIWLAHTYQLERNIHIRHNQHVISQGRRGLFRTRIRRKFHDGVISWMSSYGSIVLYPKFAHHSKNASLQTARALLNWWYDYCIWNFQWRAPDNFCKWAMFSFSSLSHLSRLCVSTYASTILHMKLTLYSRFFTST